MNCYSFAFDERVLLAELNCLFSYNTANRILRTKTIVFGIKTNLIQNVKYKTA